MTTWRGSKASCLCRACRRLSPGLILCLAVTAYPQTNYIGQARQALEAHDVNRAIATARLGLEKGEDAELRSILGSAWAMAGQPDKAVPEMETSVSLQPANEGYRFDLAQVLLRSGQFEAALAVLEKARTAFPRSAQIELALGVAFYGQHQYADTLRAFLRTMDLAPDVPQPYVFLGKMLEHVSAGLPEIAAKCVVLERSNPKNPYIPLLHAKVLIAQLGMADWNSKAQEARRLLERSIALNADSADAYFVLGCLLDRKGDYAQASELLARSIQLNPNDPVPHYRLARLYARLGQKELADREFAEHTRLRKQEVETLTGKKSVE